MTAIDSEGWACRECRAPMIGRRPTHDLYPDCAHAASGPFETETRARSAARRITASPAGTGAWQAGSHRLLCAELTAAGVDFGAYDHRIVAWLAGWEPHTCAVVAGLITRAHQAGGAS